MGSASNYWRYWRLVRLDGMGQRRVEEVASARAFFQDRFAAVQSISDALIQRELQLLRESTNSADRQQAEWCLRCFISQQIEQVCVQLELKFGSQHGFSRHDLFPFVLDDSGGAAERFPKEQVATQYRSLSSEILQTFDANRAGLSTWVTRQVRHHRELRRFLQEHGVYLATDWGILNDSSPELLRTVLTEFYVLTVAEVTPAYHLLQAFHQVYRHDRLQQRQLGRLQGRAVCTAPSLEQLTRIACYLQEQGMSSSLSHENILAQLQTIASQLRQYRLHRFGKPLPTQSLNQLETETIPAEIPDADSELDQEEENFLTFYREQMLTCLDQSLAKVTHDRFIYLQRKKAAAAEQFLTALELFHCQGQSMNEIAPQVKLQKQFQVTRLLKLKEFRANVRSRLLQLLLSSVRDQAKTYTDPTRLQKLNQQIETILEEHITVLIQQAESEAAVAKRFPLDSLFARRLCHHLDHLLDLRSSPS
jgi:predicted RNase H-like nuclease